MASVFQTADAVKHVIEEDYIKSSPKNFSTAKKTVVIWLKYLIHLQSNIKYNKTFIKKILKYLTF